MELDDVPQDHNATLGGYRKAVYARDAQGRIQVVPSTGWEVEEIVTTQAADALRRQAEEARRAAQAGQGSTLAYWMYERRMDVALLAQGTGLWQWQVRRHLDARRFARLDRRALERYARALGLPVETLLSCPGAAPGPGGST
ncbi:helix-turn-helix domain-containing protein [Sphaerotilus microaerophilus]|uniref:XRE family transcriptional regulator n=1 Tax=Sphaerotilus microaerophilus TaxID=2914710 RepID=A0ABM7YS88_9BURK|nr:helix-turn-helix transcriptional regulator [Sphaerotilus sp. FB-5]BDI07453.1 hypothetical protein CATMQ487_44230 [Sphaerotilus sp. FB-5]